MTVFFLWFKKSKNEILIICRNDISMRTINFHYYAENIKANIEGCIHSNKFYLKN